MELSHLYYACARVCGITQKKSENEKKCEECGIMICGGDCLQYWAKIEDDSDTDSETNDEAVKSKDNDGDCLNDTTKYFCTKCAPTNTARSIRHQGIDNLTEYIRKVCIKDTVGLLLHLFGDEKRTRANEQNGETKTAKLVINWDSKTDEVMETIRNNYNL